MKLKPGGIIENRQVVTVEGKGCPAPGAELVI